MTPEGTQPHRKPNLGNRFLTFSILVLQPSPRLRVKNQFWDHDCAWFDYIELLGSHVGAVLVVHSRLPPYIMTHHIHKYHVDFQ